MKEFNSIQEAFEWFLEKVYPELPPEKKTNNLRVIKSIYSRGVEGVSEKRMKRILEKYCGYKVIHRLEIEN